MSRIFPSGQYEQNYMPHRLGNWQVNDTDKQHKVSAATAYSTLQSRKERTTFVVNSKGHLLPGVAKVMNSFKPRLTPLETSPTRWPKPSLVQHSAPAATMGYKGIVTSYLPRNHTITKAVEVNGCSEIMYR